MSFIRRTLEYAVGRSLSEAINKTVKHVVDNNFPKNATPSMPNAGYGNPEPVPLHKKICPECRAPADADQKFCPYCGTALTEIAPISENVCPVCGKQRGEGEKFCTGCGEKFLPADSSGDAPPPVPDQSDTV